MVASLRSFLVAFLAVLHHRSFVWARSGSGMGGGSNSLGLSSIDAATFSFYVLFAITTGLQLIFVFRLLKNRPPQEEFARRIPYAIFIVLFTTTLLASYVLGAALWTSESGAYNPAVATPAMYAMVDFLPRLADMLILGAVLLLLRYRHAIAGRRNRAYRIRPNSAMPSVYFGIMIIMSVARLGTQASAHGDLATTAVDTFELMGHTYLAFYILVTFHVVASAWLQWNRLKWAQSRNHALFDQNVLSRIVKLICPALALRALYVLASHIITYTVAINYSALRLIDILFLGSIYTFVIYVSFGLGRPLKKFELGDLLKKLELGKLPKKLELGGLPKRLGLGRFLKRDEGNIPKEGGSYIPRPPGGTKEIN